MRKIILYLTALLLLFAACKKSCKIKYPKDIKPIDWENYNDVYTVYWNCKDTKVNSKMRDTIKIYGWIFQGPIYPNGNPLPVDPDNFTLISNEEDIFYWNYSTRGVGINIRNIYYDSVTYVNLQPKFDTSDITKKCFIKGRLGFVYLYTEYCSILDPYICVENISFEE